MKGRKLAQTGHSHLRFLGLFFVLGTRSQLRKEPPYLPQPAIYPTEAEPELELDFDQTVSW